MLSAWNFRLVPVNKDGNCFFTSVALALLQNAKEIISGMRISLESPLTEITKLRQVIVGEWLGPNWREYGGF